MPTVVDGLVGRTCYVNQADIIIGRWGYFLRLLCFVLFVPLPVQVGYQKGGSIVERNPYNYKPRAI